VERETVIVRQVNGEVIEEPVGLPRMAAYPNEGKTLAAWTLTWVVSIGGVVVAVGMALALIPLLIAGIAVIVLGIVASAILRRMGHGQPRSPMARQAQEDDETV
jgi:hypothetical protein